MQLFESPKSSSNLVKKTAILHGSVRILSPDFLKKCHIEPNSQDQWQIANFILEFKCAHSIGTIFDRIRFGQVFSLLKDFWYDVSCKKTQSGEKKGENFVLFDNLKRYGKNTDLLPYNPFLRSCSAILIHKLTLSCNTLFSSLMQKICLVH